jgi:hypothetical protein
MHLSRNRFRSNRSFVTVLILYASCISSLSQDVTTAWTRKRGFNSTDYTSLLIADGKHFVGFRDGIYRSDDHGRNFKRLDAFPLQKGQITSVKLYRDGHKIYTSKIHLGVCQLFYSTDYGETWQTYSVTLMQTTEYSAPQFRIYGDRWFIIDATSSKSTNTSSFFYSRRNRRSCR